MKESDAILLSLEDVKLFRYGVSPNKLYDAYAIGRPVITTVPGAINEEVNQNKLGFTAIPGEPNSLVVAVKKLIRCSRVEREEMSKRARVLAKKYYSRQNIIEEYNVLLKKIINER